MVLFRLAIPPIPDQCPSTRKMGTSASAMPQMVALPWEGGFGTRRMEDGVCRFQAGSCTNLYLDFPFTESFNPRCHQRGYGLVV